MGSDDEVQIESLRCMFFRLATGGLQFLFASFCGLLFSRDSLRPPVRLSDSVGFSDALAQDGEQKSDQWSKWGSNWKKSENWWNSSNSNWSGSGWKSSNSNWPFSCLSLRVIVMCINHCFSVLGVCSFIVLCFFAPGAAPRRQAFAKGTDLNDCFFLQSVLCCVASIRRGTRSY